MNKMVVATVFVLAALGISEAAAQCNISDAKLEEAILQKPELRDRKNRQMVRDLRALRHAAFILWSYGRHADCERILSNMSAGAQGTASNQYEVRVPAQPASITLAGTGIDKNPHR